MVIFRYSNKFNENTLIMNVINLSFVTRIFPNKLKEAMVIPLIQEEY